MRVHDQVPPVAPDDGHPRPAWMRGRLVVAVEILPQAAYVWDDLDPDVTWDDTTPERVWDAPFIGQGFTDVWCDLVELNLTTGSPDQYDGYPASYCHLTLRDPGDGRYVERTPDGRLVYFAARRRVAVYWLDELGDAWWLFHGAIATWRTQLDRTVQVEAYSAIADLAQPPGRPWAAGAPGQTPGVRADAILTAAGSTVPRRLDVGLVTLSLPAAAETAPIDALRQVAESDGGLVLDDADGTFVLRDRLWRDGRDDQTTVPIFTDNVCAAPDDAAGRTAVVVWDPAVADVDLLLAGTVRLTNAAVPPLTATASPPPGSSYVDPGIVWTHRTVDLWQSQSQGDSLAAHVAAERSDARMAIGSAAVHLHDLRFDYWRQVLDLRLGDRVRWLHDDEFTDPPRTVSYDLELVAITVNHLVTPEQWTVTLGTSQAVDYRRVELWDWTLLTWDSPDPAAVWR